MVPEQKSSSQVAWRSQVSCKRAAPRWYNRNSEQRSEVAMTQMTATDSQRPSPTAPWVSVPLTVGEVYLIDASCHPTHPQLAGRNGSCT